MDGGANSPATATPRKRIRFPAEILLIGSSRGLRLSRAHPEAEGTNSPPHHPFSDSAEILRISGRGICKEAIFSPGASPRSEKISTRGDQPKSSISLGRSRSDLLALWASNLSDAQVAGLDWKSRGFTPSRALPGAVLAEILVFDDAGCPLGDTVSDGAGVGRSASLLPTGCERVATLSRSPGAVLAEILVPDDAGCPLGDTVSDGAGYSIDGFVFDDTSVRRSAPLHPLGGRGREGCDPLALSRSCSGGDIRFRRGRLFS